MNTRILLGVLAAALMTGCGGGKLSDAEDDRADLPEGHPPVAGEASGAGGLGSSGPADDNPLPLKISGLSSVEEMERAFGQTDQSEARTLFEAGFRKTFTADASKRDYPGAVADLERAIALDPDFAGAYRALGYAKFNMGFDVQSALDNYLKSVELKPDYGEAHYALAFMYAMGDRTQGADHFKKAMELGIPDERGLGDRFYSGQ